MSWEQNVFSSQAQSIGYDDEAGELIVTWKNGRRSAYSGVSEDVAAQVAGAPSVGQALNSMIKGTYDHRYI